MSAPSINQITSHAAAYPFPDGGGLWRLARNGGVLVWPVRAHEGRVEAMGLDGGYWGDPPADCQWEPCDQYGNPLTLLSERDQYRARVNLLENILHDLANDVRAQRRTAVYQNSHGRAPTAGRRRIDLESYLARAGIEVKP